MSRDSTPQVPLEAPKDRRLPLKVVVFQHAVPVPGMKSMATNVETGGMRIDAGKEIFFPQVYLDPITRTIHVGEYEYPLERVVYWVRAKAALTKFEAPAHPDYTIGPRVARTEAPRK